MQLLCLELHPQTESAAPAREEAPPLGPTLADRVTRLESTVQTLERQLRTLAEKLGETNLL